MKKVNKRIAEIKLETIKLLNLLDDKEVDYINEDNVANFFTEEQSMDIVNNNINPALAKIVIKGPGDGAFLQSVFIQNLVNVSITVTYKRTVESDGRISTNTITILPRAEEIVGYTCHTSSGTNLCSIYYRTEILSASKLEQSDI